VTVKVSDFSTANALIVSGSIGWLNVALTVVPVTTFSVVLVLVGMLVALLLGLDEITVGSMTTPIRVPAATVTPGLTAAKALPIPLAASKVAKITQEMSLICMRFRIWSFPYLLL